MSQFDPHKKLRCIRWLLTALMVALMLLSKFSAAPVISLFLFALAAVIAVPGRHGENGGMTEMGSTVVSILLAVLACLLWLVLWALRQGA